MISSVQLRPEAINERIKDYVKKRKCLTNWFDRLVKKNLHIVEAKVSMFGFSNEAEVKFCNESIFQGNMRRQVLIKPNVNIDLTKLARNEAVSLVIEFAKCSQRLLRGMEHLIRRF
ncbi:MAG: hypothetical protein ACTS6H_00750 [Candidatus Hodgkinia cicadicola]